MIKIKVIIKNFVNDEHRNTLASFSLSRYDSIDKYSDWQIDI